MQSNFFNEHIVAEHTSPYKKTYTFKCSIKQCQMRIIFHKKCDILFINEEKSQLKHSEDIHVNDNHFKQRLTKDIYNEFVKISKSHGDIGNFILLYPELYSFPKRLLYNERNKINRELNNIDYLISMLEENSLFR